MDNTQRTLHGALLDSEILADVYMAMTGGQTGLFEDRGTGEIGAQSEMQRVDTNRPPLAVLRASDEELAAHEAWLDRLDSASENGALWRRLQQ